MAQAIAAAGARGPTVSAQLQAILQDNYHLGHDPDGTPVAVSKWDATRIAIPVTGRSGLRKRLVRDLFELAGATATQNALAEAVQLAEAVADGTPSGPAVLRVAQCPDGLMALDLGRADGLCAVWGAGLAGRWHLTTEPAALFRRSNLMTEIPVPVAGSVFPPGLRQLVNIADRDHWAVYTACRVAALIPDITRPVELITGQPGTVKTGTTRITVSWTGGRVLPMPREPRSWAAMASNTQVIGIDNVSWLSAEMSDIMCKAASGGTWADRAMYSDGDLFVSNLQPCSVVLNGVEMGALRGDLLSRSAGHRLEKPAAYLSDRAVAADWAAMRPAALGWLIDMACAVLDVMISGAARVSGHRMADFAAILAAVDWLWGTDGMSAWGRTQQEVYEDALEADPVSLALAACVRDCWQGYPADLLTLLALKLPEERGQPWTPRKLSSRLERAQAALESAGWVFRVTQDRTRRRFTEIWAPR